MDIKFTKSKDVLTVYLIGELDEYSASTARLALDDLLIDNINVKKIILDMSGVSFMDSTGVGLLIGRYKKIKPFNKPVYISGASVATEKVIQLSGLYNIMPKY